MMMQYIPWKGGRRSRRQVNIKDFVKQVDPASRDNADMSENSMQGEHCEGEVASHLPVQIS